jgi:hypothetical protein
MKRILTLGIVLALMAALVIPGAVIANGAPPTTDVTGTIVEAEVTVTSPSAIAFGNFVFGDNIKQSTTDGAINVTAGSRDEPNVPWKVTANEDSGDGYMSDNGNLLTNELEISEDGSTWELADPGNGLLYTGTGNSTFAFHAKQVIAGDEEPGAYSITITFTGELDW